MSEPRKLSPLSPSVRLALVVDGRTLPSLGPPPEQAWQIRERLRSMTDEQLDELDAGLHSMSDDELAVRLEQP
jgi:hypothetical protein